MTAIACASSTASDTGAAIAACLSSLRERLPGRIAHAVVAAPATRAAEAAPLAVQALPGVAIHGLTTCLGPSGGDGFAPGAIAMFAIADEDGSYGSACRPLGCDARSAAAAAAVAASVQAGRPGEMPALVLLSATPGREEEVLAGLGDTFGPHVPVVGGTAADDAVSGAWSVWSADGASSDACIVSVWYPAGRVATAFHCGYTPAGAQGQVTSAEGRLVRTIDGIPAAVWYDRATGGLLGWRPGTASSVLAATTLAPLARQVVTDSQVPQHQLSHPASCLADGSLVLFTTMAVGDRVRVMTGSRDSLVERAGRVVASAAALAGGGPVLGAVLVYCAGCMLTVRERMAEVVGGVRGRLDGAPFIGLHTFGEQGCFNDGAVRHGNLMISTAVLLP